MFSGTPLRLILESEGRKQSWLAAQVGIDQATLSRIVNGLHADEATRARIAAVLGRSVEELWPDVGAQSLASESSS